MKNRFIVECEHVDKYDNISWVRYDTYDSAVQAIQVANNLELITPNRVRVVLVINQSVIPGRCGD